MQIPPSGAYGASLPTSSPAPTSPSSPGAGSSAGGSTSGLSQAEQQFLDWANMTPAQQMRAQIMQDLGVTPQDEQNMTPQDRAKLEEKIRELVKEKVQESTEKKTGVAVDIKV
ncbi:hypothetical protein [Phenylobacterium sp.]|uniref:hypothetical protein n=1 Tax=Phenylobacterium sp. TaxID=1871053 RepID=UPI0012105E61|nr:hypothetical protein [Phenylobacterium sp.]THD57797.1 MAG: hypothetical protein E8A49_21585 [Phenylobacterium sp.]